MKRSKLFGALLALPLMFAGVSSAQANVIALVLDSSDSIDTTEYNLQRNGYISALNALLPTDGSNAIAVVQFSTTVQTVFSMTLINSVAAKNSLIAALTGMSRLTGNTAIGSGIDTGRTGITGFSGLCATLLNCIIDVSTDGMNNTGGSPATATATANAAGIRVNCLGVGPGADCSWNGTGLDFVASDFAAFNAAILAKLSLEITPTPEPLTITLFGAGLVGAGFMRRRMKKA